MIDKLEQQRCKQPSMNITQENENRERNNPYLASPANDNLDDSRWDGFTLGYNSSINTKGGVIDKSTSMNVCTDVNTTSLDQVICALQDPDNWGTAQQNTYYYRQLRLPQTPTKYHLQPY